MEETCFKAKFKAFLAIFHVFAFSRGSGDFLVNFWILRVPRFFPEKLACGGWSRVRGSLRQPPRAIFSEKPGNTKNPKTHQQIDVRDSPIFGPSFKENSDIPPEGPKASECPS